MAVSQSLPGALDMLGRKLSQMQQKIDQLERNQRAAQLGNSSVDDGSVTFNDGEGSPQLQLGLQDDGTHALIAIGTASPPNAPSQPVVQGGIAGLYVIWDGTMDDGSQPLSDFLAIQVHVSATPGFLPDQGTLQGTMASPGIFAVGGLSPGVTYYASLVAVNQAGNLSDPSSETSGVPQAVPDHLPPGSLDGSVIVTGTVTGTQIAEATITAGLLAAGIIYAGIVDGTEIIGARVVSHGNNGEVLVYNGEPAMGNLIGSWSAMAGADEFGNGWPKGLVVGANGTNQIMLLDNVGSQVSITNTIAGITQAMIAMFTSDTNELLPGLLGTVLLGTGSAAKMATMVSSPIVSIGGTSGQGAAMILQAQNDGGTDTAVITIGTVTTPDNSTEVFTPIMAVSPYAFITYGASSGQVVKTFKGAGSYPFTMPGSGSQTIKAESWGPAGKGGNTNTSNGAGGGGGAGSYGCEPALAMTGGGGYVAQVGGSLIGDDTFFTGDGGVQVIGRAGGDGHSATSGNAAAKGLGASPSANTIAFRGGDGGNGSIGGGGGGGGSPGPGGAGGNASLVSGGTGATGGADGADYIHGVIGGDGSAGGQPGAGGSGAAGHSNTGGIGGDGQVRLTYSTGNPPIQFSSASAAGTDQYGSPYPRGTFFLSQSAPAGQSGGATMFAQSGGIDAMAMVNGSGLVQGLSGSFLSLVNGTSPVTGTGLTSIGFRQIPAGDVAVAGISYMTHASGSFTISGAAPASVTFGVWWGGVAGTNIASLAIPVADIPSSITGSGWFSNAEINWMTTAQTEVTLVVGWHNGSGVSASRQYFVVTITSGLVVNINQNLSMSFQWGAGGTVSLVTDVCRISRVA